jgi:hypothetical protein
VELQEQQRRLQELLHLQVLLHQPLVLPVWQLVRLLLLALPERLPSFLQPLRQPEPARQVLQAL